MAMIALKDKKLLILASAVAMFAYTAFYPQQFGRVAEAQRGGAAVYARNCATCHGTDGRAQTRKGRESDAVDLTSSEWTPDTGRDTRIVTRGKGSMPAFGKKLTNAQISSVVQYIRRFKR
jgi:mono/diheme cytochrome c family protein